MTTLERNPATLPLRAAVEAGNPDALADAFASDAVLHSPLSGRLDFHGREQIAAVMAVVLDVCRDLRYTTELRSGDTGFLVASARVGGLPLELVDHMRLDADGRIREMTVFFRPLPASAVALRLIGAGVARRRSPFRAALISVLAWPLGLITWAGDRVGVRLVRSTL